MAFHLGKPILALLALAATSGAAIWFWSPTPRTTIDLWTFAPPHADLYRDRQATAEASARTAVSVRVVPSNALNVRLVSLFMADRRGSDLPDIIEIRQDAIGRYLGGSPDRIPLRPLNDLLSRTGERVIASPQVPGQAGWVARSADDGRIYRHADGRWIPAPNRSAGDHWIDRISASRLRAYSRGGQIFGLPRDVHPVALAYRADLFAEAGIDLTAPTPGRQYVTWDDFAERCRAFQGYWRKRGVGRRWAMDLFSANADMLVALLLQRGVNLVGFDGRVHLRDPIVVDTLLFYADLVAGPNRISADSVSAGLGTWKRDLEDGVVCAALMPDWRVPDLRAVTADGPLHGAFRLCPLPRFDDASARTTTWGGTMIALPRHARDAEQAWKVVESLYLDDSATAAQMQKLGILPAVVDAWQSPAAADGDPLFGGQSAIELYARLAPHVPVQELSADSAFAASALGYVLTQVVAAKQQDVPPGDLRARAMEWLATRQADVERQIVHQRLTTPP